MTHKDPEVRRTYQAGRNRLMRERREEFVRQIKQNGKCADCGQKYLPCQMQFDHVSDDKINTISELVRRSTLKAIEEEIAKCELVCANCHSLRTWQRKLNKAVLV